MIAWLLLSLYAAGVLLSVGLWTRGDWLLLRIATLLMLALLLLGMLLPAEIVSMLRDEVLRRFGRQVLELPGPALALWAHLILFTVTGLLVGRLRLRFGWPRVVVGLMALAVMTEAMQTFSPGRQPSWFDVGANLLGIGLGLALLAILMAMGTRLGVVWRGREAASR